MAYVVDSNIGLRLAEPAHPMHSTALHAVETLFGREEKLYQFPQNVREFWNVATRPIERNGLGLSIVRVDGEAARLERIFPVLPDGLAVFEEWRRLVVSHSVFGVSVHDAYLVAAMRVHGLTHLLTFNAGDFARYADLGIVAVHPDTVAPLPAP